MKKRNKRIVPPINKQTAFELMFGYDGKENCSRLKSLAMPSGRGKLNGQSI